MLTRVLALHLEDALFPGARERFQLAQLREPDGALAQVLHADDVRRRICLQALETYVVTHALPEAERAALYAVPAATPAEFADLLCMCERPQLPLGFYYLVHPGGLARELVEMEAVYRILAAELHASCHHV